MKDLWDLVYANEDTVDYSDDYCSKYVFWITISFIENQSIEFVFREQKNMHDTEENRNKSKYFVNTLKKKGFNLIERGGCYPVVVISNAEECKSFLDVLDNGLVPLHNIRSEIFESCDFASIREKINTKKEELEHRRKTKTKTLLKENTVVDNKEKTPVSTFTDRKHNLVKLDSLMSIYGNIVFRNGTLTVIFFNLDKAKEFNKLLFECNYTEPQDKGELKKFHLNPEQTEFGIILSEKEFNDIKQNPSAYNKININATQIKLPTFTFHTSKEKLEEKSESDPISLKSKTVFFKTDSNNEKMIDNTTLTDRKSNLAKLDSFMSRYGNIVFRNGTLTVIFSDVDKAKEFNKLLFDCGYTEPQDKEHTKKFHLNSEQTEFGIILSEKEFNEIKCDTSAYYELEVSASIEYSTQHSIGSNHNF